MKRLSMALAFMVLLAATAVQAADFSIGTKYPVTLYGFIKGDFIYDTDPVTPGNFFQYVPAPAASGTGTESEYFITANQTRLGLKIGSPAVNGVKTGGAVEIDFYGGGGAPENKGHPMMRKAYVTVDWPDADFQILAGQTGDLISPLFPKTVNYTVNWWNGNIGYRRPQFRFSKGIGSLKVQVALARTIGYETKAGTPDIQYRVAYRFPLLTDRKTQIGFSGSMVTLDDTVDPNTESNTMNVEFVFPLSELMTLKGEYWTGKNVTAYLGNIDQPGEGMGYWIDFGVGPLNNLSFHVVYGVDDPDEESDTYVGTMQRNSALCFNVFWKINKAVTWATELAMLTTEYVGGGDNGTATRAQTSFILGL